MYHVEDDSMDIYDHLEELRQSLFEINARLTRMEDWRNAVNQELLLIDRDMKELASKLQPNGADK